MADGGKASYLWRWIRTGVTAGVFVVVVVVLMMWLAGAFHRKIGAVATAGESRAAPGRPVGGVPRVAARIITVPRIESSVGTIRAVHQASVASKILAKVKEVNVIAGQRVAEGDVLARLDDDDLRARLEQAQAQADAARAKRDQAQIEYQRVKRLREQEAASPIEWDRVQNELKAAEAELTRAQQAVNEAETVLGYATIRSPIDGRVVDKLVEAGDTVTPGQVLLTLYDPTRMQLVADVRESLTRRLSVGQTVDVRIDALDRTCQGRISEIVPQAETASRTFAVKVTGPCPPGVYTGMFGRLLIPLGQEKILVVPKSAVRRVGQLDMVEVVDNGRLLRRAVQLGGSFGDDIQVLSGLREGEQVVTES